MLDTCKVGYARLDHTQNSIWVVQELPVGMCFANTVTQASGRINSRVSLMMAWYNQHVSHTACKGQKEGSESLILGDHLQGVN